MTTSHDVWLWLSSLTWYGIVGLLAIGLIAWALRGVLNEIRVWAWRWVLEQFELHPLRTMILCIAMLVFAYVYWST